MGGKSDDTPPAPDYGPIIMAQKEAFEMNTKIAGEQLEMMRGAYEQNREIADMTVTQFMEVADFSLQNAQEDRERYLDAYRPMEDSLIADAESYDSESRMDQERGRAAAGVKQQFEGARRSALNNLESYGIDPSETRFAALDLGVRTQEAASAAHAANQAGYRVEDKADALRKEYLDRAKDTPDQINQSVRSATPALSGAVGAGNDTSRAGAASMGTGVDYSRLASAGLDSQSRTTNTQYGNEKDAYEQENAQSSGWGAIAGTVAGIGANYFLPGSGGAVKGAVSGAFAEGGAVPKELSPSGGAIPDDVSANISAGEFVVPVDVMNWKGEEFFQKTILKSREDRTASNQPPPQPPNPAIPTGGQPRGI